MQKNLIIIAAGDNSLHKNWVNGEQNFDLVILYYGNSDEVYEKYVKESKMCIRNKGQKFHLIYDFITKNHEFVNSYDFCWFPDDDIEISIEEVNNLFKLNKNFKLWLSQPSLNGHVSHDIEKKVENSILRFTTFVEVICPMMSIDTVNKLLATFTINESSWGIDFLWPKILDYPENKIAIIDEITATHTRPVGTDYSRFKKTPMVELQELLSIYQVTPIQQVILTIDK